MLLYILWISFWAKPLVNKQTAAFKDLFKKDEVISKADVWLGENKTIDLIAEDNISGLFPLGSLKNVDIEINYKGPIAAPIKKGDRIAILTVNTPKIGKSEHHLVASKDVASGSILNKILASAELLGRKAINGQLWAN